MFLVFNKQKIYSYLVAFATVVVLLGMAKIYKSKSGEIVETISNSKQIEENIGLNNEVENKFILSDEWSEKDVLQLLQLLKKYDCSSKFLVNKKWKEQHEQLINQIQKYGYEIAEFE